MKTALRIFILFAATLLWHSAGYSETPYALGWIPSKHGVKADAQLATHPAYKAAPLPQTASVAEGFYETTQKRRGACVAFSANEAFDAVHQKQFGSHAKLSFLDTYQQCLVMDGNFPNDSGTWGGTALKVLRNGVLSEKTWPYDNALEKLPPNTAAIKAERKLHVSVKSYEVPNNDNGYGVKQCIANLKVPCIMGSYWYNNTFDAKLITTPTKDATGKKITPRRYVLQYPKGKPVGGHEIVIIEYDDNMVFPDGSVGGIRIHNHWSEPGAPWGDSIGSAWIAYKWAFNPHIVEDKHCIEIVKKGPTASLRERAIDIATVLR